MAAEEKPQETGPELGRIKAELEAIFRTPEFERAPVMRQLLGFLVRTTLAGGGEELKAYTVAVEGLGRDPDFDSQSDSYPRVQVGRLRKMLDAYYANGSPEDGVRFHVKQGSYRVHFVQPDAPSATLRTPAWEQNEEAPAKPLFSDGLRRSSPPIARRPPFPWRLVAIGSVLLIAFIALIWIVRSASDLRAPLRQVSQAPVLELGEITTNGGPDARMLASAGRTLLEDALHRSWLIRVRESDPTSSRDLPDADTPIYRLVGRADTSGAFGGRQIVLTLLDLQSGDQIWSDVIDLTPPPSPGPGQPAQSGSTLTDRMRPAIIALISPFGVIASHQRSLLQPTGEPGYACMLDYEGYFRYRDPAMRARVRDCVRETVAREPVDPIALSAATFISLDPTIGGGPDGLARAADYARRAVAANSKSAEAQIADARVAMMHNQCVRGRDLGLRAIALNSYNPELTGMVGFLLITCNDAQGPALLQRAIAEDPDVPAFYGAALILALVEQGDTPTALHVADTIRPPGAGMNGQYEVAQTFAQAARGNIPAAREHWAKAGRAARKSSSDVDAVLSRYFYAESLRLRMAAYLRQTGVTDDERARPAATKRTTS